jgi:hypothetical protein
MLLLAAAIAALALAFFARITGWTELARTYPLGSQHHGEYARTGGVVVGPSAWNAPPLRAGLDDAGISLSPVAPFRPFFPPLLVPWRAITGIERQEYMFFEIVRLHCGEKAVIGFLPSAVTAAIVRRLSEEQRASKSPEPKTPSR